MSETVFEQHGKDPDALVFLARVADAIKKPDEVVKCLRAACKTEDYCQYQRIYQTVIALVAVGRLHDAMELLITAVDRQPSAVSRQPSTVSRKITNPAVCFSTCESAQRIVPERFRTRMN